jgi:hypothetical protein
MHNAGLVAALCCYLQHNNMPFVSAGQAPVVSHFPGHVSLCLHAGFSPNPRQFTPHIMA